MELAPKPRTVLTVLIANAGGIVPVSALAREVWGDSRPVSALRNLQTYIFQSRKVLSQFTGLSLRGVASEFLMTRPGGYSFTNTAARFDYSSYRNLVVDGRRMLRKGADDEAIELFEDALSIWRGPAFVDVMRGPTLETQRRQFEESRIGVIESLSDAKIRVGNYHEAIADLAASISEHPLHEGIHYRYMRALHLTGHRARALDVFNTLRSNLVSELGIEPGAPVQRLQHSILNSSGPDYTAPYPPSTGRIIPVA
ncbi:AfsR/SARP family transcriptional regulator [Streptomyces sp. NPDC006632]|uniref:AfsR/SARP family transcriptional regulator n=1 Tax=unclassified Streptomyces TaxID=2593676 RepID=UPI002E1C8A0E